MPTHTQPPAEAGSPTDTSIGDLAAAIVMAMRQPKQLGPAQQSVELRFRLIRNGLGTFGGHGDDAGDHALIRIEQTADTDDRSQLTFLDPLPRRTRFALVHSRGERREERLKLGPLQHTLIVNGTHLTLVEFLDEMQAPIAAGVPVPVSPVAGIPTRTAASTATSK